MGVFGQFQNDAHREKFFSRRDLRRFGGRDAEVCGANTKTGKTCENVPVKGGNGRCLLHCGPKLARAVRDRQLADLKAGRITPAEWQVFEGRRIRNRLQNTWKKSPWFPGQTINLGEHEITFRAHCEELTVRPEYLAPAVLDWLRWRFRRLQVDRRDDVKWSHTVRVELPERVHKAGPMPEGWMPRAEFAASEEAMHRVESTVVIYKRQRPDHVARKAKIAVQRRLRPGRPPSAKRVLSDIEELAGLFHEHRATLGPLFAMCRGQEEQRDLLAALREFKERPEDRAAQFRWFGLVNGLSSRRD